MKRAATRVSGLFRKSPKVRAVWLVAYLFFFMFAPPIIPGINVLLVVAAFSGVLLLAYYKAALVSLLQDKGLRVFIGLFMLFLVYLAVVLGGAYMGGSLGEYDVFETMYRFLLVTPLALVCLLYVVLFCQRYHYDIYTLLKYVLYAALVQVVITLVALSFPEVKRFLIDVMYAHTSNPVYRDWFFTSRRGFGFANDLQDGFGYGIAVLAMVPVILSYLSRRPIWLIFVPVIMIEALANGRTAIIVALFTVLPILGYMLLAWKRGGALRVRTGIAVAIGTVVLAGGSIAAFAHFQPSAYAMIEKDVSSVFEYVLSGGQVPAAGTTAGNLLGRPGSLSLPSDALSVIFGEGRIYFNIGSDGMRSDVGYVNDIWLVGIVGSLILYSSLGFILYRVSRIDGFYKAVAIGLALGFLVYQTKSRAYMANLGTIVTLLIAFGVLYVRARPAVSVKKKVTPNASK